MARIADVIIESGHINTSAASPSSSSDISDISPYTSQENSSNDDVITSIIGHTNIATVKTQTNKLGQSHIKVVGCDHYDDDDYDDDFGDDDDDDDDVKDEAGAALLALLKFDDVNNGGIGGETNVLNQPVAHPVDVNKLAHSVDVKSLAHTINVKSLVHTVDAKSLAHTVDAKSIAHTVNVKSLARSVDAKSLAHNTVDVKSLAHAYGAQSVAHNTDALIDVAAVNDDADGVGDAAVVNVFADGEHVAAAVKDYGNGEGDAGAVSNDWNKTDMETTDGPGKASFVKQCVRFHNFLHDGTLDSNEHEIVLDSDSHNDLSRNEEDDDDDDGKAETDAGNNDCNVKTDPEKISFVKKCVQFHNQLHDGTVSLDENDIYVDSESENDLNRNDADDKSDADDTSIGFTNIKTTTTTDGPEKANFVKQCVQFHNQLHDGVLNANENEIYLDSEVHSEEDEPADLSRDVVNDTSDENIDENKLIPIVSSGFKYYWERGQYQVGVSLGTRLHQYINYICNSEDNSVVVVDDDDQQDGVDDDDDVPGNDDVIVEMNVGDGVGMTRSPDEEAYRLLADEDSDASDVTSREGHVISRQVALANEEPFNRRRRNFVSTLHFWRGVERIMVPNFVREAVGLFTDSETSMDTDTEDRLCFGDTGNSTLSYLNNFHWLQFQHDNVPPMENPGSGDGDTPTDQYRAVFDRRSHIGRRLMWLWWFLTILFMTLLFMLLMSENLYPGIFSDHFDCNCHSVLDFFLPVTLDEGNL